MEAPVLSELAAVNRRLEDLSAQVSYLTEQARDDERRKRERAEFAHDLLPIANDAVGLLTEQLEEIKEYVDLSDLLRLFKRLLRNAHTFERVLDQLESLRDLAETVGPLTNSVFEKATDVLERAEHRGYFRLMKGGARAVEKAAATLTPEDVDRLGDNLVVILDAFKKLQEPTDSSLRSLFRQMRDPDVRRGLAVFLRLLGAVGTHAGATDSQETWDLTRPGRQHRENQPQGGTSNADPCDRR